MAKGKRLTAHQKREICILYQKMHNYSKVGAKYGVSPNTVKNVWLNKENDSDLVQIVQAIEKAHKEQTRHIFEHIRSHELSDAVKNAIALFTPKNLDEEKERYGIRPLLNLVGIGTDKVIAIKELELKERQMAIRERELDIKEKELELRISNPEAFATVNIVNDAPRDDRYGLTHN